MKQSFASCGWGLEKPRRPDTKCVYRTLRLLSPLGRMIPEDVYIRLLAKQANRAHQCVQQWKQWVLLVSAKRAPWGRQCYSTYSKVAVSRGQSLLSPVTLSPE